MVDFIGTCVGLDAEDLETFGESARDITFETFRKALGSRRVRELETEMGYGANCKTTGMCDIAKAGGMERRRCA